MSEQSHADGAQNEVVEDLELAPEDGEDVRGGKVDHSEFVIVKSVDKATAKLYE